MADPLVFTTEEVWGRYGDRLGLTAPDVHFVHTTDLAHLEQACGTLSADVVYGMGGGQCIDTAKWVGERCGARVVAVPTIISVDAALVPSAAVRVGGRVRYVGNKAPDELVIMEDVILAAPARLNAAGWGDVLSIYTAVHDWRRGHERTGELFNEEVARQAVGLLERACRPDTAEGLAVLLDALRAEVALCDIVGNARPEEGSEHLFAYVIEPRLPADRKILHGELVGLGLWTMSALQGQDPHYIAGLLDRAGLRWRAEELGIGPEVIRGVLADLPREAETYQFPYSVANELPGTG